MSDIQLNDLLTWYPGQESEKIQTWITGFKEFAELSSDVKEQIPKRGQPYKHQELVARFMRIYDYLYLMHQAGTGKTCASITSAEKHIDDGIYSDKINKRNTNNIKRIQDLRDSVDLSGLLLRNPKSNIMKVLILVKGKKLKRQFKKEIICKCTSGKYEADFKTRLNNSKGEYGNIDKTIEKLSTLSLQPFYKIETYGIFASSLETMNDEEIKELYNDTFIILDEIHLLHNIEDKTKNTKIDKNNKKQSADEKKKNYPMYVRKYNNKIRRLEKQKENLNEDKENIKEIYKKYEKEKQGENDSLKEEKSRLLKKLYNLELSLIERQIILIDKIRDDFKIGTKNVTPETINKLDENLNQELKGLREIKDNYNKKSIKFDEELENIKSEDYDSFSIFENKVKNIRERLSKKKKLTKNYNQLKRLLDLVERKKVLGLSATAVVNEPQDASFVMNLMSGKNSKKMERKVDYTTEKYDLDVIEPLIRGRISYVRELDTGTINEYVGQKVPGYHHILAMDVMSKKHATAYKQKYEGDAFRSRTRQAASFIFPNGKSEESVIKNYIEIRAGQTYEKIVSNDGPYRPNEELAPYLQKDPDSKGRCLSVLSQKYQNIIDSCKNSIGKKCYIYTEFVSVGTIPLSMAFNAQGYKRFRGNSMTVFKSTKKKNQSHEYCTSNIECIREVEKKYSGNQPRYAIITGKTKDSVVANILNIYNSYENRHGDIIQVIILTETAREGVNLLAVRSIFLVNAPWNPAAELQPIFRGIRTGSHENLIDEFKDKMIGFDSTYKIGWLLINSVFAKIKININRKLKIGMINDVDRNKFNKSFSELTSLSNNVKKSFAKIGYNFSGGKFKFVLSEKIRNLSLIKNTRNDILSFMRDFYTKINEILLILEKNRDKLDNNIISEYEKILTIWKGWSENKKWNYENDKDYLKNCIENLNALVKCIKSKHEDFTMKFNFKATDLTSSNYSKIQKSIENFVDKIEKRHIECSYYALYTQILTYIKGYQTPDDATLSIQIFKHASVFNNLGENGNLDVGDEDKTGSALLTSDIIIYKKSEDKDRRNKKMERYMKQVSIDGQIHVSRNQPKNSSLDYTSRCDYQKCQYELYDPEPLAIYQYLLVGKIYKWVKIHNRAYREKDGTLKYFDGFVWKNFERESGTKIYESNVVDNSMRNIQEGDILIGSGKASWDNTNYDNLYSRKDIEQSKEEILIILNKRPVITFPDLFRESDNEPRHLVESLTELINNKEIINNRFGIPNYVNEENGAIITQLEFPDNSSKSLNQLSLGYYNENFHGVQTIDLNQIIENKSKEEVGNLFEEISRKYKSYKAKKNSYIIFRDELLKLDTNSKAYILEMALSLKYITKSGEQEVVDNILRVFENSYCVIKNPEYAFDFYADATGKKEEKRGRKKTKPDEIKKRQRYEDENGLKWIRLYPKDEPKPTKTKRLRKSYYINIDSGSNFGKVKSVFYKIQDSDGNLIGDIVEEDSNEILMIHNLYNISQNIENRFMIQSLFKADKRLRIFNSEDKEWKNLTITDNETEMIVYNTILQLEIRQKFDKLRDLDVYGVVITSKIDKKTSEYLFFLVQMNNRLNKSDRFVLEPLYDKKSGKRSNLCRICHTITNLPEVSTKINFSDDFLEDFNEDDEDKLENSEKTGSFEKNLNKYLSQKFTMDIKEVKKLSKKEKLIYYRLRNNDYSNGHEGVSMCKYIQKALEYNQEILYF